MDAEVGRGALATAVETKATRAAVAVVLLQVEESVPAAAARVPLHVDLTVTRPSKYQRHLAVVLPTTVPVFKFQISNQNGIFDQIFPLKI